MILAAILLRQPSKLALVLHLRGFRCQTGRKCALKIQRRGRTL